MARIRMVKPEFFDDPDVAALSAFARLLFIGLWTQADREGRMPYDPRRLRARLFPFDDLSIEDLSSELIRSGFMHIYTVDSKRFLQIRSFVKHQRPHPKEPQSVIPAAVERNGEPLKETADPSESGFLILDSGTRSTNNKLVSSNGNGHKVNGSLTQHEKDRKARIAMLGAAKALKGRTDVPRQRRAR